jgi:tRNA A-37 threonylcarbamoyl transferase component Bud32
MQDFSIFSNDNGTALVHAEGARVIAAALLDGQGCAPAGDCGRGELLRFAHEAGTGLIRRCRRGGVVRRLLKESYFLHNRPLQEFRMHVRLFNGGLAVPAPLGVCWDRHGLWFAGALATRQVDAPNLLDYLRGKPRAEEDTLRRCGAPIRQMHDIGVFHADLQVRNILVGDDRVYLIDFDNARLVGALSPLQRARNLLRLRRSLEKNGLAVSLLKPLCEGYGIESLPEWITRVYRAKGRLSDLVSSRGHGHDG